MQTISIDIETFSSVDLKKCGVYKYAEAPDFEILLFGYSADSGERVVIDLASGDALPQEIIDALADDSVTKWTFNAQFERVCLSRYLRDMDVSLDPFANNHHSATALGKTQFLNPESWRCTMVWVAVYWVATIAGRRGRCAGIGKTKAGRRERTHPLFFQTLCCYKNKRRPFA